MEDTEYQLLTCTRYDPSLLTLHWNNNPDGTPSPFLLLRFHVDRLLDAADDHAWPAAKAAVSLSTIQAACHRAVEEASQVDSSLKIRLLVSKAGVITGTASETPPLTSGPIVEPTFNPEINELTLGPIYDIYIDSQPSPTSIFTSTKTTQRSVYDAARARFSLRCGVNSSNGIPYDILLYNASGYVMETSIFNVAFCRGSRWLTPSESTGCLPGILRRWLLQLGRIYEDTCGELSLASVKVGDWVLVFNAVAGCRIGRIATT